MSTETIPRDELRRLYEIAIEEYRFNVRLNWDRTKYYLVLNGAVLAAAAGLHGIQLDWKGTVLLAAVFAFGGFLAVLGAASLTKGHRYYRVAAVKKTELEHALAYLGPLPGRQAPLGAPGVATTMGMQEADKMLENPEEWVRRPLRPGTITYVLRIVLVALAAMHSIGLLLTAGPLAFAATNFLKDSG